MNSFERTDSANKDFQSLVALLDKDLAVRDGEEHAFYDQFNKIQNIRHAIVCYADGKPVGCGAFKEYEPGKVEIKRMYVLPEYRGRSIGLEILQQLENWAAELNYKNTVLETGKKQPEAISLYQKAGYHVTKNYGQYENVENSVCMAKELP